MARRGTAIGRGRLGAGALILGLIVVVVVVVTAGLLTTRPAPIPRADAVAPPAPPPLLVSAGLPGRNLVRAGAPATVTGHALGARAIQRLELWAGATRVAELTSSSGAPALHAVWDWVPAGTGSVALFVRAIDDAGRMATSNAIHVDVAEPPRAEAAAAPVGGDTGTARLVRATGNREHGGDPGAPFAAPRAPAKPDPAPAMATLARPTITVSIDGCDLTASVGTDVGLADGTSLFVLGPASGAFTRVAVMKATEPKTTIRAPAGTHLFAGSVWDEGLEVFSDPIAVDLPGSCGTEVWDGDVSLVSGVIHVPQPVDRGYAYATIDGLGPSQRIPQDPNAFLSWAGDGLDARAALPALDGKTLDLEVWGWKSGELVFLGTGTYTAPPAGGQGGGAGGDLVMPGVVGPAALTSLYWVEEVQVQGGPGASCSKEFCIEEVLRLDGKIERPPETDLKPIERTLRWTSQQPGVTKIAWQILPYAPPNSPDLSPPFLIDDGIMTVAGVSTGDIVIDFRAYLPGGVKVQNVAFDQGPPPDQMIAPIFAGQGGADTPLPPPTPTPKPTGGSGASGYAYDPNLSLQPASNQFWVRVIPFIGPTPGVQSGAVRFDVVDPFDPIKIDQPEWNGTNTAVHTIEWSFTSPKAPDPKYVRCAIVVDVNAGLVGNALLASVYQGHKASGEPLCYDPPDEGWDVLDAFDAFVEFVADAWDFVSESYAWIKEQVVKVVLAAAPCDQIASEATCEAVAKAALDGVLMAAGIPPSLPDFDAVVEAAKGDLATLVVDVAADQFPVVGTVCDLAGTSGDVAGTKDCADLAKSAIDEVVNQVKAQQSKAAGQSSGWSWPGVVLKPDPRGLYHPPRIAFTVTRTSAVPVPPTCWVRGSMHSTVEDYTFDELIAGVPKKKTADVSGQPFLPEQVLIPDLAPGQTYGRELLLTDTAGWTESQDSWEFWYYYHGLAVVDRGWVLLQEGAVLTFGLTGNCSPTVEASTVLTVSGIQ